MVAVVTTVCAVLCAPLVAVWTVETTVCAGDGLGLGLGLDGGEYWVSLVPVEGDALDTAPALEVGGFDPEEGAGLGVWPTGGGEL